MRAPSARQRRETRSGRTGQRNENGYLAGVDAPRARDQRDAMDADHGHEHEHGHRAVIRRRQRLLLPAAHREQPLAGAAWRPIRSGKWKGTALTKVRWPGCRPQTGRGTTPDAP